MAQQDEDENTIRRRLVEKQDANGSCESAEKPENEADTCRFCSERRRGSKSQKLTVLFVKSFAYSLSVCLTVFVAWATVNVYLTPKDCRTAEHFEEISEQSVDELTKLLNDHVTPEKASQEKPGLTRIVPQEVGESVTINIVPGEAHTRVTRSLSPPIFEIENFLSEEEISHIMELAEKQGLASSTLFRAGDITVDNDLKTMDPKKVDRISSQTWLTYSTDILRNLKMKLERLTELPKWIIDGSEQMQVVTYGVGGHYHAHLDSGGYEIDKPCCHQAKCDRTRVECCRLCRYATVLYYLNDVDEGGETAFPYADEPDREFDGIDYNNLSYNCYNASLVVKPKKGTAIFWYNHFVDETNMFIGDIDFDSMHGGCDVLKGTKWIANSWISAPTFEERDTPSVY